MNGRSLCVARNVGHVFITLFFIMDMVERALKHVILEKSINMGVLL